MLSDLRSPSLIILKGGLFLCLGLLAGGMLIAEHPDVKTVALLSIVTWSFCRAYYFAFYVIEHYVDSSFKFAGLSSLIVYFRRRRRERTSSNQSH